MIRMISFEGGDGSGKTTQIRLLENHLTRRQTTWLSTREPGGTTLGKLLRRVLTEGVQEEIGRETELFLYLADRAQHVRQVIEPALREKKLILCDRFTDSTLAYQGYGRGMDRSLIRQVSGLATAGLQPDLTILLDCPVELGLGRAARRSSGGGSADRFEMENKEFHERVRQGFLEMARMEPQRFVVLDGSRSPDEVHEEIKRIMDRKLLADSEL